MRHKVARNAVVGIVKQNFHKIISSGQYTTFQTCLPKRSFVSNEWQIWNLMFDKYLMIAQVI